MGANSGQSVRATTRCKSARKNSYYRLIVSFPYSIPISETLCFSFSLFVCFNVLFFYTASIVKKHIGSQEEQHLFLQL